MKFTLSQLYTNNVRKPLVKIDGEVLQWDECDLASMPSKKTGVSFHDMGITSVVPYEELPKTFKAIGGVEYRIESIHMVWGGVK